MFKLRTETNQPVLFEEKISENKNCMISMTRCITEVDKNKNLVVTIEKHGLQPVVLEKGLEIGYLEPIQLVSKGNEIYAAAADIEQTQQNFPEVNHCSDELCSQLDLEVSLTEGEKGKLRSFVIEYNDVFAKEPSELGCTNVVQHTIGTGAHPPLPPSNPFSLRKWTEELANTVNDKAKSDHKLK